MPDPLRSALPRAYQAFLGRFDRPSEIQARAVPLVLARRDVLLCAPTASGKTEAYAAPLAELQLGSARAPLSALLVSPTRALANDLFRRLEAPMHALGLCFGRHTGEHKEKAAGAFPEVCIVTPEGLDSLLARRPRALGRVHGVVLDEIHVLDGTARGDHLRVLLQRLEALAERRPQRLAASATVTDPAGLAARYLADAAIATGGGARSVRAKAFHGTTWRAVAGHLAELARARLRKVLVFCNARAQVDELATKLRGATPFEERVYAHHGSLSRIVRERTERRFLEAASAVAVATLTLELGIDIGTVDYVLLVGPPPDVASLMQRVGRGGRRGSQTRLGYACASAAEELRASVMLRCGARGDLCGHPYAFRPSVLVQQAIALAGGGGHVSARELERATPPELRAWLGPSFASAILASAAEHGVFEQPRGGRHVLAGRWERRFDAGRLHSNFAEPAGIDVVDRLTGDVLGRVESGGGGGRLSIGGEGRRIVRESEGRILTDRARADEPARYAPSAKPITSLALARRVAQALGAGEDELLLTPLGPAWCLVHGLGTFGGLFLAAQLAGRASEPTPFTLKLAAPLEELPRPGPAACDAIDAFVGRHAARLARSCALGPYHAHLPSELRRRTLRAAVALEPVVELLARASLRRVDPARVDGDALADL